MIHSGRDDVLFPFDCVPRLSPVVPPATSDPKPWDKIDLGLLLACFLYMLYRYVISTISILFFHIYNFTNFPARRCCHLCARPRDSGPQATTGFGRGSTSGAGPHLDEDPCICSE